MLNFRKISITPDWITISASNLRGRCVTAMQRCRNSKPEGNSHDVIK